MCIRDSTYGYGIKWSSPQWDIATDTLTVELISDNSLPENDFCKIAIIGLSTPNVIQQKDYIGRTVLIHSTFRNETSDSISIPSSTAIGAYFAYNELVILNNTLNKPTEIDYIFESSENVGLGDTIVLKLPGFNITSSENVEVKQASSACIHLLW